LNYKLSLSNLNLKIEEGKKYFHLIKDGGKKFLLCFHCFGFVPE